MSNRLRSITAAIAVGVLGFAAERAEAQALDGRLRFSGGAFYQFDDTAAGILIGFGGALINNDRWWMDVDIDFVRTSQTVVQEVAVDLDGNNATVDDKVSRYYLPAYINFGYLLTEKEEGLRPYVFGSVGWTSAWSFHDNVIDSRSRTFYGPMFRGGLGFMFGNRTFLEAEVHGGSLSRSSDDAQIGTPTDEDFKPAGFAVRFGIWL